MAASSVISSHFSEVAVNEARSRAVQLHLSSKTVDTYRSRLMQKLGVADVAALVRYAVREGLIDPKIE